MTVDTRLRGLLTRDYVHFQQPREAGATWLALPSTAVTVIINLGAPFGGLPGAFVAGPTDHGDVVDQHGKIDCLDLKLTPLGAYRLLSGSCGSRSCCAGSRPPPTARGSRWSAVTTTRRT